MQCHTDAGVSRIAELPSYVPGRPLLEWHLGDSVLRGGHGDPKRADRSCHGHGAQYQVAVDEGRHPIGLFFAIRDLIGNDCAGLAMVAESVDWACQRSAESAGFTQAAVPRESSASYAHHDHNRHMARHRLQHGDLSRGLAGHFAHLLRSRAG